MVYVTLTKIKDVVVVGRYSNCGCIELNSRLQEFPIPDSVVIYPKLNLVRQNVDEIQCLKEKIICEYNEILRQLECGIQPDIENLLEEISLIDIYYE